VIRCRVICGPGIRCHIGALKRWCRVAGAELGAWVELVHCDDDACVMTTLDDIARGEGVILAAGSAGDAHSVRERAIEFADAPLVWLELAAAVGAPAATLTAAGVSIVHGRGVDGFRWALRSLIERSSWPVATERYGSGPELVGDLRLPVGGEPPYASAVLIHGGAWRECWQRDLMDALAVDLARRGYATWNIEFRRVGGGGGWPETFLDVAAAVDHLAVLADDAPLDLERVALVGHSAGGHLALWAAARNALPAHAPGGGSAIRPRLVVSLAGLPDLRESARRGIYEMATDALMGGPPDELNGRYTLASPSSRLPLGTPQLLVHGTADQPDNVDMNRLYAEDARAAGDDVELLELPGVDHFALIDPRSVAWAATVARLQARLPPASTPIATTGRVCDQVPLS